MQDDSEKERKSSKVIEREPRQTISEMSATVGLSTYMHRRKTVDFD